jgi:anti-sigma-K factor RskA
MSERLEPIDVLLGELSEEDQARAERLMSENPGFRSEVERLRPIVAHLDAVPAEIWEEVEPPPLDPSLGRAATAQRPGILQRLLGSITVPAPALAAAAIALLIAGVVIGVRLADDSASTEGREIALSALGDEGWTGVARVNAETNSVSLDVSGLDPSTESDFYEFWLLTAPAKLVSLGSFTVEPDGTGSLQAPLPVPVESFEFLDVSREPLDGDPSHSSDSVLRGATA